MKRYLALQMSAHRKNYLEKFVSTEPKNQIQILVALTGRSESFKRLIDSYNECCRSSAIITISYYGSDSEILKFHEQGLIDILTVSKDPNDFSRGQALNFAARWVQTQLGHNQDQIFFFCDVDFTLSQNLLQKISRNTSPGQVYFPIFF